MNFLKKRKEAKFDIIVSDNKKILADVNKIAVPDLKQYLVRGYEEIKQVKAENEQLEEQLEEALKYKEKYEATLVISDEYEHRYNSQKYLTGQLEQKLERKREEINKLQEQVNNYEISKHETERKIREQIEEADDVLVGKEYIDNFDGSDENQEYYYKGYKDASLFIRDTLED